MAPLEAPLERSEYANLAARLHTECAALAAAMWHCTLQQHWPRKGSQAGSAGQAKEAGRDSAGQAKEAGRDSVRARKGSRRDSAGHATSRDGKVGANGNGSDLASATAGTKWNRRAS